MYNLIRYYFKNKYKIWAVIIFIVLLLLAIQVLNKIELESNQKILEENRNSDEENIISNYNNSDIYISNTTVTSGEKLNTDKLESASDIIQKFISACNNSNIEEAYSYLSEDCKKEMYPTVDIFNQLYYNVIFNGNTKKVYVENWISDTYKVEIAENILETGNINQIKSQDYITIIDENKEIKLNINNFIKKEEINKSEIIEGIEFTILNKYIYKDYEKYDIEVKNQTGEKILLDSQSSSKSIYIIDQNETKYYSYSHEILNELLTIDDGFSRKITLKFSKEYSNNKITNSIIFSNVIINYNKENMSSKLIEIEI